MNLSFLFIQSFNLCLIFALSNSILKKYIYFAENRCSSYWRILWSDLWYIKKFRVWLYFILSVKRVTWQTVMIAHNDAARKRRWWLPWTDFYTDHILDSWTKIHSVSYSMVYVMLTITIHFWHSELCFREGGLFVVFKSDWRANWSQILVEFIWTNIYRP